MNNKQVRGIEKKMKNSKTVKTVEKLKNEKEVANKKNEKELSSRGWCFTLNNYTDMEVVKMKQLAKLKTVEKLIFGKEVGEECGTPHLQGYIYWSYSKKQKDMKLINNRLHLEVAKGGYMSQTKYCTKDKIFFHKNMKKYIEAQEEEEQLLEGIIPKKWSIYNVWQSEIEENNIETYNNWIKEKKDVEDEPYILEDLLDHV